MAHQKAITVRARIRLLSTAEGGRTAPVRGSYRPNHNFFAPDSREMAMAFIELPPGMAVEPGGSIELSVTFWDCGGLEGEIYPGREWRIQEGAKLVGIGTVLSVLPS